MNLIGELKVMQIGSLLEIETQIFHKTSNFGKSINSIWELKDSSGYIVHVFKILANLSLQHFSSILKGLTKLDMHKMLKVISFFANNY